MARPETTDPVEKCIDVIRDVMNNTHSLRNKDTKLHNILSSLLNIGSRDLKEHIRLERVRIQKQEKDEWKKIRPALMKLFEEQECICTYCPYDHKVGEEIQVGTDGQDS